MMDLALTAACWLPASARSGVMRNTVRCGKRVPLLLLAGALLCCVERPTLSQDRRLAFDQVVGHPRGLPQLPPQGAWGEVINATPRWIVIQNHSGQQFPIALDDIG